MAARSAGAGTGRIEQDRVETVPGLPRQRIGAYDAGLQSGALEIVAQQFEPPLGDIERGNLPAGRGELERLAAGRGAEIERVADLACICLLYTSPSPRDATLSRMPSSA